MIYGLFLHTFLLATDLTEADWFKYVLWWSIPMAIIGLCALLTVIIKLVRMIGESRVCRVPLAVDNELDIGTTGRLNLCLEIPMFTLMPTSGLRYELLNSQQGGQAVELKTAWLKTQTSSGLAVTSPVRVFDIKEPGKYLLRVSGLKPQKDYSRYFVVISRPFNLKATLYIFAILLTGGMFVGGFVFSLIASGANK